MTIGDAFNYILFTNPISTTSLSLIQSSSVIPPQTTTIVMAPEPLWKLASSGQRFVKIAGISGAMAVMLGAYGAHSIYPNEEIKEIAKKTYDTANRYHFIHTVALLGAPLCRYPALSGTLMIVGMTLFCGSCYYNATTGDSRFRKVTPIGGTCLILGWLAMAL